MSGGCFGPADGYGARFNVQSVFQHHLKLLIRRRGHERHAGDFREQHHVQNAVVGGAVIAGDACAIQSEHHGLAQQPYIQIHLVNRPREECGIYGHHGSQATHRHACCCGHGVLLGDAHIEAPIGETLGELQQSGGIRHSSRKRNHLRSPLGYLDERLGESLCVAAFFQSRSVVHALDGVVLCRGIAATFLGEHMNDHRFAQLGGVAQSSFHACDVVAVEGARVAHA